MSGNDNMIYQLDDNSPTIADSAYIAPSADVIGKVSIAEQASVWFGAVLRGDTDQISIGKGSNIQDNAVCHADPGFPLVVEDNVTVGHKVMLHGCSIGEGSLIGINAVVLNGAVIGKHCLIGANALVTENMQVPDGSMVLGSPAKIVKTLPPESVEQLLKSAQGYQKKAAIYQQQLKPIHD